MSSSEIILPILGYEGLYNVSSNGYVISLEREVPHKIKKQQLFKSKILSGRDNGSGYKYVDLCKKNNKERWYLHKLVATYFVPNSNNLKEVNHLDGNKSNNAYWNLEWTTRSENNKHAYRVLGRKVRGVGGFGIDNIRSRAITIKNLKTGEVKKFDSIREAQKHTGSSLSTIHKSLKGGNTINYSYQYIN